MAQQFSIVKREFTKITLDLALNTLLNKATVDSSKIELLL